MIDINNPLFTTNVNLLVEGFWHRELPPILDLTSLSANIVNIMKDINSHQYDDDYRFTDNGLICELKNINSPTYIYNDGCEAITFYDFKKNGSLRELQLPNIKHYLAFMYNMLFCYDSLFMPLYSDYIYDEYVQNSNSYILFNETFHIVTGYENEEESFDEGIFAVNNDKTTGQFVYEENNTQYLKKQGSYLYSVKIDIESFYPNIYTHNLSKIKNDFPYNLFSDISGFFDFLDYYNMKINNNQTKGIVTGVFSSVVSAELLMLCVDHEIRKLIGNNIEYIRYVDDLTFFSDSLEEINTILPSVQQILNNYRLRINNSKTERYDAIHNASYTNIDTIKEEFDFIYNDHQKLLDKNIFYRIKDFISIKYDTDKKADIKAFLTLLKNAIQNNHLQLREDNKEDNKIDISAFLALYMLQLSCLEPLFASRCYKVIIAILDKSEGSSCYNQILTELKKKSEFINKVHNETILQIWHYYVLGKYDGNFNLNDYLSKIGSNDANPLILSALIKEGDNSNPDIMKYIKDKFSNIERQEGEPDFWKTKIMNSKWWFPLFVLFSKDTHNYSNFFSSNHYSSIYKNVIRPPQE